MAEVSLTLTSAGSQVHIGFVDVRGAGRTELEHTLMLNGALPDGDGVSVPVFAFRRASVEVARLLGRLHAEVRIAPEVEALLRTQLGEISARRAAEAALEEPTPAEVTVRVAASGRFTRELTGGQVTNLQRLLALAHGANFSVPGAGKTSTALALYEVLRHEGDVDCLIVVAPKNAFVAWDQELAKSFAHDLRPDLSRLEGGRRGVVRALQDAPEIAIISYQLLPNALDLVRRWAGTRHAHVVLDESHRVKAGYSGVTASAALDLAGVAVRRDILSGTPLPHAAEDLRPQLDFLWPGQRIMPELRIVAEAPAEVIEEVERSVRSLYVRTTKEQLKLPELSVNPRAVELGPLQHELYDVLRSEAARTAAAMPRHDRRFFRLLGRQVVRLIQAASNPMLLTQGTLVERGHLEPAPQGARAWELLRELARYEQPAKITRAVERAREIAATGKVLIWSTFVLNLTSLEELLADLHPVLLYGAVPTGSADDPDTREGRIRRFHDDDACRVMIANPAAAGEGISLHMACHHAIYLDRSFNAAHYLQSVDRIHRLGLPPTTVTHVEVLEAQATIDQRLARRLNAKIEAMSQVLNDPGLAALAYDPDDIEAEFEGGIELDDVEEIVDHLQHEGGDS